MSIIYPVTFSLPHSANFLAGDGPGNVPGEGDTGVMKSLPLPLVGLTVWYRKQRLCLKKYSKRPQGTEGGNTEGGAPGPEGDSAVSLGSQRGNLGSTELSYHKGTGGKGTLQSSPWKRYAVPHRKRN